MFIRSLLFLSLFGPLIANSQSFTLVSEEQQLNFALPTGEYGNGVSFYDFDKDGWDDLTLGSSGDSIRLYHNNNGNLEPYLNLPSQGDVKQVVWADYDNDGDADLFVARNLSYCSLYNNDAGELTDVSIEAGVPQINSVKSYGASWGDYDNDGFIDLYICNYHLFSGVTNWLLHNNGDGTFSEVAEMAGVDDGIRPSFQSTWFDYDLDGDLDIHVANDKSPENSLYENNGDGTFLDVSEAAGVNVVIDAMCSSITDFDNDGDFDIYVTNGPPENFLHSNNGDGTFTNVAQDLGVFVNAQCWGALWIDFDNDMDDDIHVNTNYPLNQNQNYFYRNIDGESFGESNLLFDPINQAASYALAKGDFNNDGFYDFIEPGSGNNTIRLWENTGGENNFIKINLQGLASNADGIGAFIEYFVDGNRYIDFTRAGDNLMSQDSQHMILGLGSNDGVDSLFIHWPSSHIDGFYNLNPNENYTLTEGESVQVAFVWDGISERCVGDSLILDVGEFDSYLWSTGDTSPTLTVDSSGTYFVSVMTNEGLTFYSDTISVDYYEEFEYELITEDLVCSGDSSGFIEIIPSNQNPEDLTVFWNNGDAELAITNLDASIYSFSLIDDYGCIYTNEIEILQPEAITVESLVTDISCFGYNDGSILVFASGGSGNLDVEFEELGNSMLPPGSYTVVITDSLACVETLLFDIEEPDALIGNFELIQATEFTEAYAMVNPDGGTEPYNVQWSNEVITNESGDLNPGEYSVTITDANNCTWTIEFTVEPFVNINELDDLNLNVFPNPAKESVNISGLISNSQIRIFSIEGKIVFENRCEKDQLSIDVSTWEVGLYRIEISNDGLILAKSSFIHN